MVLVADLVKSTLEGSCRVGLTPEGEQGAAGVERGLSALPVVVDELGRLPEPNHRLSLPGGRLRPAQIEHHPGAGLPARRLDEGATQPFNRIVRGSPFEGARG